MFEARPAVSAAVFADERALARYLLQDGVDPVQFAVDEEAFLLPAVHLLNDASVLGGVHDVPHRASGHLPVIGDGRLHDGLEDGKTWRSRWRRAPSHNCRFWILHACCAENLIAVTKRCEGILAVLRSHRPFITHKLFTLVYCVV